MINLSYHLSESIESNLKAINQLRINILTEPIKPKTEMFLRWNSNIEKAYWGLTLADNPLTKRQITKILEGPLPKRLKDSEKEVISYINTLNYIRHNWTGSFTKNINTDTILNIYNLSCKSVFGSTSAYYKSKVQTVDKIIEFIEKGKDHPVIKAGLIQIEIIKLSPFENGTGRVARLLSHLMLSKYGFDMRGLLVLEDYYREDLVSLKEAITSIEKSGTQSKSHKNATQWLEYFTSGVKKSMEKLLKTLSERSDLSDIWKLTDRQKKISERLNNPNIKITNKEVQKMFKVSQITASRDLSKMVNFGILLPHGKGRSVFYTK